MVDLSFLYQRLPSVAKPEQKLTLRDKAMWTGIMLVLYFLLGSVLVWGVNPSAVSRFEFLEIVFGSRFGSLITLGIGPIVTASIILQLLVGSKIIDWDLKTAEGKEKFTGSQKLLGIAFSFIEGIAYVLAGAVPPISPQLGIFVMLQLALGGIIIIFMDEVVSKWGIGSGISLFIAAGVSKTIMLRIFSPTIGDIPGGVISAFISSLSQGQPSAAFLSLLPLVATIVVFFIVVFAQSMKIEIPMAITMPFGKFAARRWPLKFIYTSNIPVILVAAVIANIQVLGRLLFQRGITFLGDYDPAGRPLNGIAYLLSPTSSIGLTVATVLAGVFALIFAYIGIKIFKKHVLKLALLGGIVGLVWGYILINAYSLPALTQADIVGSLVYMSVFIIGSVIFSIFWVSTSGMDASSVAEQFKAASIVVPGFRHDPRIIEKLLNKYIPAVTVLGGAFVGFLASFADLTSAIGTGTGILLTVMIMYQLYEQLVSQHYDDLPPQVKKFLGI